MIFHQTNNFSRFQWSIDWCLPAWPECSQNRPSLVCSRRRSDQDGNENEDEEDGEENDDDEYENEDEGVKDENEENILVGSSTWDLNSVTFESRIGFSNPFTPILANKSSQDEKIRTHGGVTGV